MFCHEDAIRGCNGPGYSYKDVKMLGVPLKEYPELCKLAMALGKACGVLSWSIGVDVIHYINDRDGVGWHTDVAQGATMVAAVVIATGSESRPIKIREFGRNKEIRNYPEYELDLTRRSVYVMNGVMQKHYQHMVPPLTNKRRTAPTRVNEHRIAIVFRDGVRKDVEIDSGIPASQSSRLHTPPTVQFGVIEGIYENVAYHQNDLQRSYAHRVGVKGINGNMSDGADALIVSNNDPRQGEFDGKFKHHSLYNLLFSSHTH